MGRSSGVPRSVLDTIGNTPVVELSRLTRRIDGRIVVKLDYLNPGFLKKDRVALRMIEEAERDGLLRPGQTVVELTSGNAGTGFAIVCALKGYPFVAVMSHGNSPERAQMMRALGAAVVLVDQLPESVPGQVSGAAFDRISSDCAATFEPTSTARVQNSFGKLEARSTPFAILRAPAGRSAAAPRR